MKEGGGEEKEGENVLKQDENSISKNLLDSSQLARSPPWRTCWQKRICSLEHGVHSFTVSIIIIRYVRVTYTVVNYITLKCLNQEEPRAHLIQFLHFHLRKLAQRSSLPVVTALLSARPGTPAQGLWQPSVRSTIQVSGSYREIDLGSL